MVTSLSALWQRPLLTIDTRQAFLQSTIWNHEAESFGMPLPVFVKPPLWARTPVGPLWRLLRPCYGLGDAPLIWFQSLQRRLLGPTYICCRSSREVYRRGALDEIDKSKGLDGFLKVRWDIWYPPHLRDRITGAPDTKSQVFSTISAPPPRVSPADGIRR